MDIAANPPFMAPFYQVKVQRTKQVLDRGVVRALDDVALTPTRSHVPARGEYYVNERKGIYIFNRRDVGAELSVSYADVDHDGRYTVRMLKVKTPVDY